MTTVNNTATVRLVASGNYSDQHEGRSDPPARRDKALEGGRSGDKALQELPTPQTPRHTGFLSALYDTFSGVLPCLTCGELLWHTRHPRDRQLEPPLVATLHSDQELKPMSPPPLPPSPASRLEATVPRTHVDVSWGPLADHRVRKEFDLPWDGPKTRVTVTCPEQLSNETFPVVVMFPGFMCMAKWYRGLVDRVVSWGFAVVQYDVEDLINSAEMAILDPLLQLLSVQVREGALPAGLDLHRLAVVGHSRGGLLAALHLAKDDLITAAVLIDPVDMSGEAGSWREVVEELQRALPEPCPGEMARWPDLLTSVAARLPQVVSGTSLQGLQCALQPPAAELPDKARARKLIGIVGAAGGTRMSPLGNYHNFWSLMPSGSRLLVLPQAGPMQFLDLDAWVPSHLSEILGKGESKDAAEAAAVFTAACLNEAFLGEGSSSPFGWRLGHYEYVVNVKRAEGPLTCVTAAADVASESDAQ
ncbi:hypothetical protein Vretimale_3967 [Volvox reticuliferus]|uniref:Chlorophyllase n=1 Tax=Volvox reticuliferus TaxID=1737510 RepID=A0A8J4FDW9_9CHLO|nr:hypothetical protein Vretifemale_1572 [Volvox reticuliferus]GIL98624.1 hypothetical protein Vretimale_3967 [Volvox reticuliferus]